MKAFQCSKCACLQMDDAEDKVFCHAAMPDPRWRGKGDREACLQAFTPLPKDKQWHYEFPWEYS